MSTIVLKVEILPSRSVDEGIIDMIVLAKKLDVMVSANFNGYWLNITRSSTRAEKREEYQRYITRTSLADIAIEQANIAIAKARGE